MSAPPPLAIPQTLPVMVLVGGILFPHSLLPLYLFEPRYREMLAHSLGSHRMFALANLEAGPSWTQEDETDDRIRPIMTAGVVRACVGQPDGTSRLMLQGVARVRILGWEQSEPFRIAKIAPVPTLIGNAHENARAADKLLEIVLGVVGGGDSKTATLATQLKTLDDPEVLSDFVAANFLLDPADRQHALELDALGPRLQFLLSCLGQG